MASRRDRLRPSRRLGLRARITAAFALGTLVLAALMAGSTYLVTRENLLRQRESSARGQVYGNARVVRDALTSRNPDVPALLSSLQTEAGRPVLLWQGDWFANSVEFGRDAVPLQLRTSATSGQPLVRLMRYASAGEPQLAVSVPIPAVDAVYFELVSLDELENTLGLLGVSLFGAAVVTTLAGAALGVWAGRRTLRPLAEVGRAAEAIAGGRLDTRLESIQDKDLGSLTASFNRMVQALEDRIERDARFASDVSHELRSPLTTLSAAVEVLQSRREEMPERAVAALDLLVADVQRFQSLVEDLLEISRFDAGAARLDLERVRVGELLLHVVGEHPGEYCDIEIDAELDQEPVEADKRRLSRVVANLLDNARTYGGGATRVAATRVDGNVQIVVEDAGPGVPPDERQHVFERFARGGSARHRGSGEGVGLGLALVAEHVQLHGGRVWVEDRPDGHPGARFVVELPASRSTIGNGEVPATEEVTS